MKLQIVISIFLCIALSGCDSRVHPEYHSVNADFTSHGAFGVDVNTYNDGLRRVSRGFHRYTLQPLAGVAYVDTVKFGHKLVNNHWDVFNDFGKLSDKQLSEAKSRVKSIYASTFLTFWSAGAGKPGPYFSSVRSDVIDISCEVIEGEAIMASFGFPAIKTGSWQARQLSGSYSLEISLNFAAKKYHIKRDGRTITSRDGALFDIEAGYDNQICLDSFLYGKADSGYFDGRTYDVPQYGYTCLQGIDPISGTYFDIGLKDEGLEVDQSMLMNSGYCRVVDP